MNKKSRHNSQYSVKQGQSKTNSTHQNHLQSTNYILRSPWKSYILYMGQWHIRIFDMQHTTDINVLKNLSLKGLMNWP